MTDAEATAPTHNRSTPPDSRRGWITAGLVLAALLVGVVVGRASRSKPDEEALPNQPRITASPAPGPTVTVSADAIPAVTVTATVSAEPESPVTVTATQSLPSLLTETIATPECLRALDLADQGFGIAQRGFAASKELVDALNAAISSVRSGDFGAAADAATQLSTGTEALSTVSGDLTTTLGLYNTARDACINR